MARNITDRFVAVRCGIRTHAHNCGPECLMFSLARSRCLKSGAFDRSANLTRRKALRLYHSSVCHTNYNAGERRFISVTMANFIRKVIHKFKEARDNSTLGSTFSCHPATNSSLAMIIIEAAWSNEYLYYLTSNN